MTLWVVPHDLEPTFYFISFPQPVVLWQLVSYMATTASPPYVHVPVPLQRGSLFPPELALTCTEAE